MSASRKLPRSSNTPIDRMNYAAPGRLEAMVRQVRRVRRLDSLAGFDLARAEGEHLSRMPELPGSPKRASPYRPQGARQSFRREVPHRQREQGPAKTAQRFTRVGIGFAMRAHAETRSSAAVQQTDCALAGRSHADARGTEPLLEGSRRGQGFPEERSKWPEAFNRSIARG